MHTSTRGAPAAPTVNGDCPRRRHSRKCSHWKSLSRSTGVAVSTTGATGPAVARRKIDAGKRLIYLQRPRLTRPGVNMTPVVQAKRDVAVLLNLEHHHAAAQSVDRSSRQEDESPGFGVKHARWSATVLFASARRRSVSVTPGFRPA